MSMRMTGFFVMRLRPTVLRVLFSCTFQVVCGFSAVGQGASTVLIDALQRNAPGVKKLHRGEIRDDAVAALPRQVRDHARAGSEYAKHELLRRGVDEARALTQSVHAYDKIAVVRPPAPEPGACCLYSDSAALCCAAVS